MSIHNTKKDSNPSDDDVFFSFKTLRSEENNEKVLKNKDHEVVNIYHKNMPKKLERKSGRGLKVFLFGLIIIVIASGVFYFYGKNIFNSGQFFSGNNIKLEIIGLSEAAAGEEISYIVKYKNLEKVDLSNVVLNINYPSGFVYKKATPLSVDANNNSWELGYLRPGRSGQVEIFGVLIGEQDQIEKISAKLTYNLGSEKSSGSQKIDIEIKISSSVITLDIDNVPQLSDENIEYIIKYGNMSLVSVDDIKIIVEYPENFIFDESEPIEPQKNSDNSIWLINQLEGKENKELIIKGRFITKDEQEDQEKTVKVQIGLLDVDDVFYLQQEKEFSTLVSEGDMTVNVELNNSVEDSVLELGDTLEYLVSYSNQSEMDLADVKLKLIINSNIIDWTSLEDDEDRVVNDEEIINGMLARSIIWNMEDIKAGDEGSYTIKFKTKIYSQLDKTRSLDLRADAHVQVVVGELKDERVNKIIEGNKVKAQVNTELSLQTKVSLKDNQEYQIDWQLTNSIHEVENLKVEAILASGSNWVNNTIVSAGDIYFDPDNKTISWQINRIPVGLDIPLTAKFNLDTSDEGRPKLLLDLKLTAKDKTTGAFIEQTFSEVMGY